MKNTSIRQADKSMSYEPQNGQKKAEKKSSNLLEESEPDISQEEQLPQDKQRSRRDPLRGPPSAESSISMRSRHPNSVRMLETTVPCLVKQPDRPELKGLIREERGDRFTVYIPDSDSTITVSKLFVYPDLSQLDKCSRKKSDICEAVSFRTSIISTDDKVIDTWDKCSRKKINPSKKRREKGRGTAYIECKPITKNRKEYKQYWFHWQVWRDGETSIKKSRYISKRLVPKVEKMNNEKVPSVNYPLMRGRFCQCWG